MARKSYHYSRDSARCGRVTIHVSAMAYHSACGNAAQPVKIRVTQNRRTIWNPARPLCLSPRHDIDSVEGRAQATEAAVKFLEHSRCGKAKRYD